MTSYGGRKIDTRSVELKDKDGFEFEESYHIKFLTEDDTFQIQPLGETLTHVLEENLKSVERYESIIELKNTLNKMVNNYINSLVEKEATRTKVIVYDLNMNYEMENEDGILKKQRQDEGHGGRIYAPMVKFGFRVMIKITMGDEIIGYCREGHEDDGVKSYRNGDYEDREVPWTQETEDFFLNLRLNINKICHKLDSFFGDDAKILLENINSGNLLTLGGDK